MLRGHTFAGGFSQESSEYIRAGKRLRISAFISASFLLIFAGLAVFPVANSVSDTNAAKKDLQTTTLSMSSSDFYANPKVTSATGTFTSSSTEISVSTDNYTGYTIGIAAKTDDSDYSKLKSVDGELNSISSATTEEEFSAASGTSLNGLWGYKPSMLSSSANTDFLPAPTFEGDELNRTNSANVQADTYTISLGARADSSTPYGRYKNAFVLRTVANPIGIVFAYHDNTEDTVTNMPANISASLSDEKIVVSDTEPERSGYDFTGWCDGTTRVVLGVDYCDNDQYDGGDDYWLDRSGATVEVNLYAMWKPTGVNEYICNPNATTIGEAVCMQDMNNAVKSSMTVEQQYKLFDSRDGKTYYVSKLDDGNVWMTQDLGYELSTQTALVHASSDIGWSNYDENASWTPSNGTIYDDSGWVEDYNSETAQSYKIEEKYYIPSGSPKNDKYYTSLDECGEAAGSKTDCEHRKTGVMYNWSAATASGDTSSLKQFTELPNSVCPAGWRLPRGERDSSDPNEHASDYTKLMLAYNYIPDITATETGGIQDSVFAELSSAPLYLTRSGYYSGGGGPIRQEGASGQYYTNTASNYNNANIFEFYNPGYNTNSGYLYATTSWGRGSGIAVRCIARDSVTISFDANGGQGTMDPVTLYGDSHLPANQFTKTDKSFVGWNTERNGSGTNYGVEYATSKLYTLGNNPANVTLYAQWRDKTLVIYEGNGANSGSVEVQYVDYKQEVPVSDNGFVRDGYAFVGWNTEADGSGVDYDPGDMFTANEIDGEYFFLYAKWIAKTTYTVNYNSDDGVNSVDYECFVDRRLVTKYSHTQNIDDTGRKLDNYGGSWTNANITGTDRGDTTKAHVLTFPGATSISVDVYYNGENTRYDWASIWQGSRPNYTAYNNYSSSGYIAQKLGGYYSDSYVVNGNTISNVGYSHYDISNESVTFGFRSDGGGSGDGYGYYAIASAYVSNTKCTRKSNNYVEPSAQVDKSFIGWSAISNITIAPPFNNEDDVIERLELQPQNLTLYAIYGKYTSITFDANGGTGSMATQNIPYRKTQILSKNIFTREGYDFYVWNTQADGSGTFYIDEQEIEAVASAGESITLYAQWSPKAEYTVNYHNGENTNTVKYNCWDGRYTSKKVAHTPNVADDGTMNGSISNYINSNNVITIPGATRLHVKLTYGTSSVSYAWASLWAGSYPDYYASGNYNQGLKLGDNTTGMYGGTPADGDRFVVEGDIAGDTVTVGFYSQYQSGYGFHLEVTYDNDAMMCDAAPVQGQYVDPTGEPNDVFTGWSFDNTAALGSYMNELEAKSALTTDSTVVDMYAIWAKPTVVSFDNNGGNGTMEDVFVRYGETITIPNNAFTHDNEYARFQYWDTAADHTGTHYNVNTTFSATEPTGDTLQLYATWGMPTIVHFDANGGTGEMADMVIPYNDRIYAPMNQFVRANSSFYQWNAKPDNTGWSYYQGSSYIYPRDSQNLDGGEMTIYAIWSIGVTFEFDANGGVGEMEPFTVVSGSSAPLPPLEFTNEGYMFAFWNTESDGSGKRFNDEEVYYANSNTDPDHITLYAIWGNPTTIVYDGNGADSGSMDNHTLNYGDTINLDANQFVRDGYVFVGWNTQPDVTGISYAAEGEYIALDTNGGEHTLYAVWGDHKLQTTGQGSHNEDNENPSNDPEANTPSAGAMTLARSYEIYYASIGKGMYVPHKDPQTGEYDGTYFEATQASDYEGIPASDLRFAMQDMNPIICNSVTVYDEIYDKVIDLRDNKSYYISKLRDGQCWMTQNLDLDLESTPDKVAALTSENTDINYYNPTSGSDYYNNGYSYDSETGVITWTPSADTIKMAYQEDTTISGWGTKYKTTPASLDIGDAVFFSDLSNYGFVGQRLSYSSIDACTQAQGYRNRCKHLQSGNYYNFAAAIAINQANTPELSHDYNADPYYEHTPEAPNTICPKGWRMLQGGEIYNVVDLSEDVYYDGYGNSTRIEFRTPLFFSRAGRILDGKLVHDWYSNPNEEQGEYFFVSNKVFHTDASGERMSYGYGRWLEIRSNGEMWGGVGGSHMPKFGEGSSIRCIAR